MRQAVIYTRISPNEDRRREAKLSIKGASLDLQLSKCRALCELRGLTVIAEHCDNAVSGADNLSDRPGLQAALSHCSKTEVVLVVYSLSRLSRRMTTAVSLLDPDGDFRLQLMSATESFDTTTAMGRAFLGMMIVWNQFEREQLSERITASLAARREKGLPLGPKPLSVKNPALVEAIRALAATGNFTMQGLVDHLNADPLSYPTSRGKKWHTTQVARVLKQSAHG